MSRTQAVPTTDGGGTKTAWSDARDRLRAKGLRWTPQRRLLMAVLAESDGHVTATELVERCRQADPHTTPSTVYRTLDMLEQLDLVRHCHGADGREEFHVLPETEHGHLFCSGCGEAWDIERDDAAGLVRLLDRQRGFMVDLTHLAVVGLCRKCRDRVPGDPNGRQKA